MRSSKQQVLAFAESLERREIKKHRTALKTQIRKQDLFVPVDRMGELISLKQALELGLVRGNLAVLNRKANNSEMKAMKLPGQRGWFVLREWLEEFNNSWVRNQREKAHA